MTVRVGQIWRDKDQRERNRRVKVVDLTPTHAIVNPATMEDSRRLQTRIRLDRLPKFFTLEHDPEAVDGVIEITAP